MAAWITQPIYSTVLFLPPIMLQGNPVFHFCSVVLCFAPTCYSSLLQGPSFTPVFFLQLYEVFVITWSHDNMASSMALCLDEVGRDDDSLERGHA